MYLLGIDTGTTNWKANLYDYRGKLIVSAKMPTQTRKDSHGRHYYDPNNLWKSVCSLTRQVVKQIKNPEDIKAVGFGSMAEAGLLVDERGDPVSHIVPWYDNRSLKEKEYMERTLGRYEIFKTTGICLTHIFSAPKILWFKNNDKKAFRSAAKWLCMPDFLIHKFTGEYATDYSIATRTAAFDIKDRKWSPMMLDALGVDESFFPKASVSGTIVGMITKNASEESSLAVGTKIGLGGHDHVVGAYGIGLFEGGDILDSIGTSESVITVVPHYDRIKQIYESGFSLGCYTYKNMYYLMSGIYCSGGLTEWFMREFYDESLTQEQKFKKLGEDLKKAKGNGGIFTLPYWLGRGAPYKDSIARGAYMGLTSHSTRGEMLVSMYEGLSYELRQLIGAMQKATALRIGDINVIGGGAKNEYWMKTKASILGRKLTVPQVPESVCFGAALMAGVGAGEIKDPRTVTKLFKKKYFAPDRKKTAFYTGFYNKHYWEAGDMLVSYYKGMEF